MKNVQLKGAYASINLDHIIHNYREAKQRVGDHTEVTCVIKSDAYGHGERQVAQALIDDGIKIVCVSTIIEGIRLRNEFPEVDILILGYTPVHLLSKVSEYRLIQTISSVEEAEVLNKYPNSRIHLKINTGMNRLGFNIDEIANIKKVSAMEHVEISGIFTHLHSSDSSDPTSAQGQYERYETLIKALDDEGIAYGTKHVCNSGGIIEFPDMHHDMAREGIMLYGMYPSKDVDHQVVNLKEAMSYHSYVSGIHHIKAGEGVSYGHTFIAKKDMTVATINIGYSDGVFRHLSNKGEVIIRDQRVPIVGRVCMNMIMIDVTHVPDVAMEDDVILFGASETQFISIDEVADWVGTISYEIVCRTGYSVPRVFIKNNEIIEIEQELLIVQ